MGNAFFENIKDKVENVVGSMQNRGSGFTTDQFNDPIANSTNWNPLVRGGTNFRTHTVEKESRGALRFKPTLGAMLFGAIFLFAGITSGIVMLGALLQGGNETPPIIMVILFPLVFSGVGIFMLKQFSRPIMFDKRRGYFWKGNLDGHSNPERAGLKTFCRIDSIHALQIVSEWCRSDKSSYTSYELNLILKDSSRLNVVDHGNYRRLHEDALQLANYLNVPLWDGNRR